MTRHEETSMLTVACCATDGCSGQTGTVSTPASSVAPWVGRTTPARSSTTSVTCPMVAGQTVSPWTTRPIDSIGWMLGEECVCFESQTRMSKWVREMGREESGWLGGCVDGCADGQMNRQMDGQRLSMSARGHAYMLVCVCVCVCVSVCMYMLLVRGWACCWYCYIWAQLLIQSSRQQLHGA